MRNSTKLVLSLAGLGALLYFGRLGCFYAGKYYDTIRRPWAYAGDPGKSLLVGHWQGACTDPDQVAHQVKMEIFVPTTDEERWRRFSQKRIKRDRSSPTFFDGLAVLETGGRRDSCKLWGGLDKADGHGIHFQFSPLSGVHPPGFNLNLLKGTWQGDSLHLSVTFSFFRADGSSFYDSADPRHSTEGVLKMVRRAR